MCSHHTQARENDWRPYLLLPHPVWTWSTLGHSWSLGHKDRFQVSSPKHESWICTWIRVFIVKQTGWYVTGPLGSFVPQFHTMLTPHVASLYFYQCCLVETAGTFVSVWAWVLFQELHSRRISGWDEVTPNFRIVEGHGGAPDGWQCQGLPLTQMMRTIKTTTAATTTTARTRGRRAELKHGGFNIVKCPCLTGYPS